MSLFNFFRRGSAPIARERLQILLAHERNAGSHPDLLGVLHEEIIAVIGHHVTIDPDRVQIKMDRGKSVSTLAVDIEIPNHDQVSGGAPRYSRLRFDAGRDDSVLGIEGSGV